METFEAQGAADDVPSLRHAVTRALRDAGAAAWADEVELAATELLTNALLHGLPPVSVSVDAGPDGAVLVVRDAAPQLPARLPRDVLADDATTGRGLSLVEALSDEWGVTPRADGKLVWARWGGRALPPEVVERQPAVAAPASSEARLRVDIGEAPTALLLAARAHLDGLLRELALAASGSASGVAVHLPEEVADTLTDLVEDFAEARQQIQLQALAAQGAGLARTHLVLDLSPTVGAAAAGYQEALEAADRWARDARLLTLESPIEVQVLRRWYTSAIAAAADGPEATTATFVNRRSYERALIDHLHELDEQRRSAALAALLQPVTSRLAAAETVAEIAEVAINAITSTLSADAVVVAVLEPHGCAVAGSWGATPAQHGDLVEAAPGSEPTWVEDVAALRPEPAAATRHRLPGALALARLPMSVAGAGVGMLEVGFGSARVFDAPERAYLEALAAQTGQAIGRARAVHDLRLLRDELQELLVGAGGIQARLAATDLAVLRTLYQEASIGLAVLDPSGRYLRINPILAATNSRTPEEHLGRTIEEVLGAGARDVRRQIDRVLATGEPLIEVLELTYPDGRTRWWRTSWFPVHGQGGAIEALVALAEEISGQYLAERERRIAERRSAVLARAGEVLSGATDELQALRETADLLLPEFGDWVAVHLRDVGTGSEGDDDLLSCALVVHVDPAAERELADRLTAGDRERLRGSLSVPIVAHVTGLGLLEVGRDDGRDWEPGDVALVEDLGRRLGLAIATARALADSVRLELALTAADIGSYAWDVRSGRLTWDGRLGRLVATAAGQGEAWPLSVSQAAPDQPSEVPSGTGIDRLLVAVHPDDRDLLRDALATTGAQGGEFSVSVRARPGAAVRWLDVRGRAVTGPDGQVDRVLGAAVDSSQRREDNERVVRALELMADGFLAVARQWEVTYLNGAAERLLGVRRGSVLGHKLRDALGDESTLRAVQECCERAWSTETAQQAELLLPTGRVVQARVHPTDEGVSVYLTDISDRRAAEADRDAAQARVSLLSDVGLVLGGSLDAQETGLRRLAELLAGGFADLAILDVPAPAGVPDDPDGQTWVASARAHPGLAAAVEEHGIRRELAGPIYQVLTDGGVHVVPRVDADLLARISPTPGLERLWREADPRFAILVPLTALARIFGVVILVRCGDDAAPFSDEDVALALEVGRRAGVLLDNAAVFRAQREVAETLQRSMLPRLPDLPGVRIAARYEPSTAHTKVGGDWYDAFALPRRSWQGQTSAAITQGFVIGDVMGHDLAAAAAMGQLRSVLRSCAVDGDRPSTVLERLDRLVDSFAMADLATVVYARLEMRPGAAALVYANAGHPPPLLLSRDGRARYLRDGMSPIIGAPDNGARGEAQVSLESGDTLLLYTDGVVERRGVDLDESLDQWARLAQQVGPQADVEELCDALVRELRDNTTDDAALLAVRLL